MVKHIVFFKLYDDCEENKTRIKNKLLTMKNKIEILKNIEVGLNFSDEDRAYDIVLLTDFESKKDLEIYAVHQYHLKIISFMKSVTTSSKVVDFKY